MHQYSRLLTEFNLADQLAAQAATPPRVVECYWASRVQFPPVDPNVPPSPEVIEHRRLTALDREISSTVQTLPERARATDIPGVISALTEVQSSIAQEGSNFFQYKHRGVLHAIEKTIGILNDFPKEKTPDAIPLELEARLLWISAEQELAAGRYPSKQAEVMNHERVTFLRDYFYEDDLGIPSGWRQRIDAFGISEECARQCMVIRTMGACLDYYERQDRGDPQTQSEIRAVTMYLAMQLGPALKAQAPLTLCKDSYSTLKAIYERIAPITLPEMQPLTAGSEPLPIRFSGYWGGAQQLDEAIIDRIVSMEHELLINNNRQVPQEGFGRVIEKHEWLDFMKRPGAHLITMSLREQMVGFYLLFTDSLHLPPDVQEVMQHPELRDLCKRSRFGFVEIVGITKAGRAAFAEIGANGYDLVTNAVMQTAQSLRLDQLFATVRTGPRANLAEVKHKIREWRETGAIIHCGETPYKVLRVFPFSERYLPLRCRNEQPKPVAQNS